MYIIITINNDMREDTLIQEHICTSTCTYKYKQALSMLNLQAMQYTFVSHWLLHKSSSKPDNMN